jgi:hypothetical protein
VEEFVQTVKNIAPTFGGINLEDISAPRCFEIERRLIAELDIPVFHDDNWPLWEIFQDLDLTRQIQLAYLPLI